MGVRGSIAAAVVLAVVLSPACTLIEPEVGDRLGPCVDADSNPNATVNFKAQIRPLMAGGHGARPCADCHVEGKNTHEGYDETGFDVSPGKLFKGGRRTGADIVVKGSPCKSGIVRKLRGTFDGARMPKGGPYWPAEDIQLMMDWIAEGAPGLETD